MDKTQQWALVIIVLASIIGVSILLASGGAPHAIKSQKFRAASPTMVRSKARPIKSSTQSRDSGQGKSGASASDTGSQAPSEAPSSEPIAAEDEAKPQTPYEQVVARSLNALTPLTGVEYIRDYLRTIQSQAEISRLYSTMGLLYSQTDPPQLDNASDALKAAADTARNEEDVYYSKYIDIDILQRTGRADEAMEKALDSMAAPGPATLSRLRIGLVAGKLHQDAGEADKAEGVYKRVMDDALGAQDELGAEAVQLYRLAAFKLVRLYRASGRVKEADGLAERMNEVFAE